jgi:diguanylate cyclase (GGDEF)-like protein
VQAEILNLALYDSLTQLPNRRLLNDRLGQMMAASQRNGRYSALMFIDLDNFKSLNDTRGHEVGDLLLIEAAERLKRCVREIDTVARFGGDEFVVMLSELSAEVAETTTQAGMIAEKIRAVLDKPYVLQVRQKGAVRTTVEHQCTASIGVALFSKRDGNRDDILKWADKAMYQAKEAGRNVIRFYDPIA